MFGTLFNHVLCPVCEHKLFFSYEDSFKAYENSINLANATILEKTDLAMNEYFVFICNSCDSKYRYTYKDIYRVIRTSILKKLLCSKIQEQATALNANKDNVIIYCGKCSGYDGKGSCPRVMFVRCEIKKLPME